MLYLFGNLSWPLTRIPTQIQKFCKFFCNPILQPHIKNISGSLTTKCYTFSETSHDPWFGSRLRFKHFANFVKWKSRWSPDKLQTPNSKLQTPNSWLPVWTGVTLKSSLPEVIPPKCYTFLETNLSWHLIYISTQMQKFCKFFCNPILQIHTMKTSRGPTSKCYTFMETSHDPWLKSQLRCKNFANFFATQFCKPPLWKLPEVLLPECYTFLETSHDPWLRSQLRCKNFANFFHLNFANPHYENF